MRDGPVVTRRSAGFILAFDCLSKFPGRFLPESAVAFSTAELTLTKIPMPVSNAAAKKLRVVLLVGASSLKTHALLVRVETSITSCGAASFIPAALTRMNRALARRSGRVAAPR